MDNDTVTAVGAIASIVSATGVVGGGVLGFILARRRIRREKNERWRLDLTPPHDPASDVRFARVVYLHGATSYRVLRLSVVGPLGAELRYRAKSGREVGFAASIEVDDDMREGDHDRLVAYSVLPIDVRLSGGSPSRSALRISAEVEERSADRRRARIVMTSQQITWTANNTQAKA